jgi:hypothetical protein
MEVTRTVVNGEHLQCGKYKFEHVKELPYLGTQLIQTNSNNSEIHARIISGNKCYYSCGKIMKSRSLNRNLKLEKYTSLIRPVVTYRCEARTLTTGDEQHLRILERKILRKIFGLVQDKNGSWRIRMNYELNELIGHADIVRLIKSRRIAWLGHVMRMDEKRIPKSVLERKPTGRRIRGRKRKRWV